MERLTYRDEAGRAMLTKFGMQMYCSTQATADCFAKLEERLAAYEDTGLEPETLSEVLDSVSEWYDAHKEGRLLVPPCKVGEMVFYIRGQHIIGDDVKRIVLDGISGQVIVDANHCYLFSDFGKTIFLTREEAEAKLKECENDG